MISDYLNKIIEDEGDVYYDYPSTVVMPSDPAKYIQLEWLPEYTWFKVAYITYSTPKAYWIIMAANKWVNPWLVKDGDKIKILLPEYVGEIKYDG